MNLWPRTSNAPGTANREPRTIVVSALLCPICFGASDAPMAQAMNWSVLTLLAITVVVLAVFGSFFVRLARRAEACADTAAGDRERGAPPARSARGEDPL